MCGHFKDGLWAFTPNLDQVVPFGNLQTDANRIAGFHESTDEEVTERDKDGTTSMTGDITDVGDYDPFPNFVFDHRTRQECQRKAQ
eukprot:SAG11_NODE_15638_length_571_cov_0.870763_1_plen_85_part_10